MKSNLLVFQGAVLLVVSSWLAGCSENSGEVSSPFEEAETSGPYEVVKVTDGDTVNVLIDGEKVKVRIIGIDTPEVVSTTESVQCYGPESSVFAEEILGGSSVYLEYDESQGLLDKFGRTLAHVWTEDKELYSSEAIANGFGVEHTYDADYKYKEMYLEDQSKAKASSTGLWGNC
jgi:micrococcal nuclease